MNKARILCFLKFSLCSNSGAALNTFILWIGHKIFKIPVIFLTPMALFAAIFCNFNINDRFTWKGPINTKLRYRSRLVRYLSTSLVGAFCTYCVLIILYKFVNINYLQAIIIASLCGAITNFTIYDIALYKT